MKAKVLIFYLELAKVKPRRQSRVHFLVDLVLEEILQLRVRKFLHREMITT